MRALYRCLDCPATVSPRYDIPKAAPEPLLQVQQFLNSIDLENEVDWLPGWLDERGLAPELERARTLRSALRELAIANNGDPPGDGRARGRESRGRARLRPGSTPAAG